MVLIQLLSKFVQLHKYLIICLILGVYRPSESLRRLYQMRIVFPSISGISLLRVHTYILIWLTVRSDVEQTLMVLIFQ
jgi:hypothetical protein